MDIYFIKYSLMCQDDQPSKRLSRSLSESITKTRSEPSQPTNSGFERATPKGAKATNFEISSPRNFAKVGGFDFGGDSLRDMKVKLELADKALRYAQCFVLISIL